MSTREAALLHDPLALLVEPDAEMRRLLRSLLRGWGYEPVIPPVNPSGVRTDLSAAFLSGGRKTRTTCRATSNP